MNYKTLNKTRAILAAIAESIDYFRLAPRIIILCYGWVMYEVVKWYMAIGSIVDGISVTPSTQHTAFVATMVGVAGVIFGLYGKSGITWDTFTFTPWDDVKKITEKRVLEAEIEEDIELDSNEEVGQFKSNNPLFDFDDDELY